MADFLRIVRSAMARKIGYMLVVAIAAFITSQCAHAASPGYVPAVINSWTAGPKTAATVVEVCQQAVPVVASGWTYASVSQVSRIHYNCMGSNGSEGGVIVAAYANTSCRDGTTPTNDGIDSECIDNPTNNPPPANCQAGRILDSGDYTSAGVPLACISGCQAFRIDTGPPDLNCSYGTGVGLCVTVYPAKYQDAGDPCTGTGVTTPKTTPEAKPCPVCDCLRKGQSWGTVNSQIVCLTAGTPGSNPVKNSPGTTSSTGTTKTGTGATTTTTSTTSTSTTTFNGNGTATTTTTTTTTPPTGNPTTTTANKTEPIEDFCKANPTVKQCKADDKGKFGGSCGSWSCDGDAATCAIAIEQHRLNCKLENETNEDLDIGKLMITGNDGTVNPAADGNQQTVDMTNAIDSSSPISASCFADKVIGTHYGSFTIPLSQWCPYLTIIGNVFMALSLLAGARIIGGV